jgi:hypothetical protein
VTAEHQGNGGRAEIYRDLGRLEGVVERLELVVSELSSRLNGLDCGTHRGRLEAFEQKLERFEAAELQRRLRPPSQERSPSGQGHAAVKALIENTERHVLEQVETVAGRTVEDRLAELEVRRERDQDRQRASIRWWLETARVVIGILAGAGIVGIARCELPRAQVRPAHHQSVDAARGR